MGWGNLFGGANSLSGVLLVLLGIVIGLVVYGVRRLVDGRLVPRAVLEDARANFQERLQREKEISEAQRESNQKVVTALERQAEQVEALIREQQLVRDVMQSVRAVAEANVAQDLPKLPRGDVA